MTAPPKLIVLFEDAAALTLEPLTLTRPVWELRCGIRTLGQKIQEAFSCVEVAHFPRPYLAQTAGKVFAAQSLDARDCLWVNGALLAGEGFSSVMNLQKGSAWIQEGRIVAFHGKPPAGWTAGTQLPTGGFDIAAAPPGVGKLLRYPWELVHAMNAENAREARQIRALGQVKGEVHRAAVLLGRENIYIAEGCKVGPCAVLDASLGPIVLDESVQISAHVVIEGPTYLGPRVQVKPLTHIRGSCLGEESRVGGEISVTIVQGFSNKQHGGFLGHSYIGAWCNLGSGTETSNLKNNYTPVKVQVGNDLVDAGELFVGLMMGDHSKTAIGSVFNTGTVVGVACNLFGAGFPPRFIPAFSWGGAEKLTRYPFNRTLEIARAVIARRGQTLSDVDIEILRWVYDNRS